MYFAAASYALEEAHRALGQLSACRSRDEVVKTLDELLTAAKAVPSWLSQHALGKAHRNQPNMTEDEALRRVAFESWFGTAAASVTSHPLHSREQVVVVATKPGVFCLDIDPTKSALDLCSDYLDKITALYERAKHEIKRLGLDDVT